LAALSFQFQRDANARRGTLHSYGLTFTITCVITITDDVCYLDY
jgi:hypothetical protein